LATLTAAEQTVNTNQNLEKLIALTGSNQVSGAVGYIGKVVEAEGTTATLKDGQASFSADIPLGAASVTVGVVDSAGKPLYSNTGKVSSGHQTFLWDGTLSFGGGKATDGIYTIGVVARDAKGAILQTKTYNTGKVASVDLDGDEMMLTLEDGQNISVNDVSSVREAPKLVATN
jgi:flagellar basal-body rod modification protein FlgD